MLWDSSNGIDRQMGYICNSFWKSVLLSKMDCLTITSSIEYMFSMNYHCFFQPVPLVTATLTLTLTQMSFNVGQMKLFHADRHSKTVRIADRFQLKVPVSTLRADGCDDSYWDQIHPNHTRCNQLMWWFNSLTWLSRNCEISGTASWVEASTLWPWWWDWKKTAQRIVIKPIFSKAVAKMGTLLKTIVTRQPRRQIGGDSASESRFWSKVWQVSVQLLGGSSDLCEFWFVGKWVGWTEGLVRMKVEDVNDFGRDKVGGAVTVLRIQRTRLLQRSTWFSDLRTAVVSFHIKNFMRADENLSLDTLARVWWTTWKSTLS